VLKRIPGKNEVKDAKPIEIKIDIAAVVGAEHDRIKGLLAAEDVCGVIARYPVRETPALTRIAEQLGFQDREQYEAAVLKLLIDDAEALAFVRGLFDDLATAIEA
jgi:hypothetical protein